MSDLIPYSEFCKTVQNPCKISKSSEQQAGAAYEGWYYDFRTGQYADDTSAHGFSITTLSNAISFLPYGDTLTTVDTSASFVSRMCMRNAKISRTGNFMPEYTMSRLMVGKQYPLADPNVLAVIVKNADERAIMTEQEKLYKKAVREGYGAVYYIENPVEYQIWNIHQGWTKEQAEKSLRDGIEDFKARRPKMETTSYFFDNPKQFVKGTPIALSDILA